MSRVEASETAAASDDRRARYLEIAQRLFAEHGFVGTTMDMIVAEAGGSKATLYKYFPEKDALVEGMIDDVAQSMNERTPALALDDVPLDEALTTIGRSAIAAVTGDRAIALLRLSLGEYGRFPQLARVVWEHGPAVTYDNFRRFLDVRGERGEIEVDDTQLAAEHFVASLVGHIQLKVAMGITKAPTPEEIDVRVAAGVRTFMRAHATDPERRADGG